MPRKDAANTDRGDCCGTERMNAQCETTACAPKKAYKIVAQSNASSVNACNKAGRKRRRRRSRKTKNRDKEEGRGLKRKRSRQERGREREREEERAPSLPHYCVCVCACRVAAQHAAAGLDRVVVCGGISGAPSCWQYAYQLRGDPRPAAPLPFNKAGDGATEGPRRKVRRLTCCRPEHRLPCGSGL